MSEKKMLFSFPFEGQPVPHPRARVTFSGAYMPKKYTDYKNALAKALKQSYGYFAWDIPPIGDKARSKWLKQNRYALEVLIWKKQAKGDVDNFVKTVMDALQDAGVIANDCQVDDISGKQYIDKQNPRITVTLYQLKG